MKPEIVLPRASAEFPRLPVPVRKLLPLCDGTRTLSTLSDASGLSAEQTTRRRLQRLVELGDAGSACNGRETKRRKLSAAAMAWLRQGADSKLAFSNDEEAFFASPIDHLVEQF